MSTTPAIIVNTGVFFLYWNSSNKEAKNRIINISNYLVKEKGINPKQIVMTDKIENNSSAINLNISKK